MHLVLPNNSLTRVFSTISFVRISCLFRYFYLTISTFTDSVALTVVPNVRYSGRLHNATWFRSDRPDLRIRIFYGRYNFEIALFCCSYSFLLTLAI
jgi:hypothetical protein